MSNGKTVVVWSCGHAKPETSNERFTWLGKMIYDLRPDYCVDLGDGADMCSLNTYDSNYPKAIINQSYEADINSYLDSQERLKHPFKKNKKKQPRWIGFEGNHEHRIKKALAYDPRLEGEKYGISFGHLQTKEFFDQYHEYSNSAPALINYDGVLYGHYVSANKPTVGVAGIHAAYSLLSKVKCSVTVGHSHKFSYHYDGGARPHPLNGLVVGCFKGEEEAWAGQVNAEWRKGVCIKRGLNNGNYDLEWVSMERIKREYG